MTIHLILASIVIPFLAESLVSRMPAGGDPRAHKRHLAFYLLTPIMGLLVYVGFLMITAHANLALAGSALYFFGLTAVSNKKYEVLRDPFNAHDFDNARNLYIYPEFYVSYVGWPVLITVIALFSGAVGVSIWLEDAIPIYDLGPWYIVWPITLLWWFASLWLLGRLVSIYLNEQTANKLGISFDLKLDVPRFGLFGAVLLYRILLKNAKHKEGLRSRPIKLEMPETPADIIAIQGESYFDLQRLFCKLGPEHKWQSLNDIEAGNTVSGNLEVPAWGAYTMQTEFSFLSGIENRSLGIDRINPYMRFAQKPVTTYVSALRDAGYRTVCIHPAKTEFFRRASVMPNLGFEDFVGIEAFEAPDYFGKYISDKTLAEKIDELITDHHKSSDKPLFIFAITIESHGPWAKGRLEPFLEDGVTEASLISQNLTQDPEFSLYQKHMENLLSFYRRLTDQRPPSGLADRKRVVAMYGDHMPALGPLFDKHGFDDIATDYLLWNSEQKPAPQNTMSADHFASVVLQEAGITVTD